MAPHSSTLARKIPRTEEPGRLQSMGSLRVRHDWATSFSLFTFRHWRWKCQPTPVFLPGESQGRDSMGSHRVGQDCSDLAAAAAALALLLPTTQHTHTHTVSLSLSLSIPCMKSGTITKNWQFQEKLLGQETIIWKLSSLRRKARLPGSHLFTSKCCQWLWLWVSTIYKSKQSNGKHML